MESVISETVAGAERAAAEYVARHLVQALHERGRASLAISGGRSPWGMFDQLAAQPVDWRAVHLFQVDERIAPSDDEARNWKRFLASALAREVLPSNRHPMPVEIEGPEAAAAQYAGTLAKWAGEPPVLDVVHLGIGADGHTASLFTGDSALLESRRPVAVSKSYEGLRRLTLTLPVLNRARCVVWFAVGAARRTALTRLFNGDTEIPASLVQRNRATCFTDREAAPAP